MTAALLPHLYGYIIALVGAIAAAATVYFKGRSAGKAAEQKKSVERDLVDAQHHAETIRETSDVQAEVTRLPDATVQQRLRDEFSRD
jgi:hypothetical protein